MDMIKKKLLFLGMIVPMFLLPANAAAQHPHDGHYRPDTTALSRTQHLGEVVVLENLGILFESELGIDVLRLLRKVSKMALTVLLWPGEIGEDRIYFLNLESGITLKQTDINYITI